MELMTKTMVLVRGKNSIFEQNCALDETSMKLGIVVDHNPDVENSMRTHLKTAPVPRSDDVIIRQEIKLFLQKFNRNISN